ncbi:MAG: hypothetical protein HYR90_02525 [Candidatus Andersenbacteria bacterium]|nr:hypothetical protein [Candidatus Andersenbacteria bacterium]MBI3251032.1 hypothetical protein [Candidatus Andersenbacteria bacterium]
MTDDETLFITRVREKFFGGMHPVPKILAMCLFLAIKDRVQTLSFVLRKPEPGGLIPIGMYVLADNRFLVPPPQHLARHLGACLKEFSQHSPLTDYLLHFRQELSDREERWEVTFNCSRSVMETMELLEKAWDDAYPDMCAIADKMR